MSEYFFSLVHLSKACILLVVSLFETFVLSVRLAYLAWLSNHVLNDKILSTKLIVITIDILLIPVKTFIPAFKFSISQTIHSDTMQGPSTLHCDVPHY